MKKIAIHGNSRPARCSQKRRMGVDQPASDKWCTSTMKSAPRQMVRKNM